MLYRRLGSGSQAETFEGVDRKDGRAVAVKRFDVHGAASWKDVDLAEREARVLATLEHPALPAYIHRFEHAGALYLVMQKVEGQDLAQLLDQGHRFTFDDLVVLLETLAGVFDYLHRRSPPIVHRDVKPSNIVRRPDGGYSLIDFGSVRDGLRPAGGSTVVGTFGFMAPEQFQGRALPASDLYGTGATLMTLLTGVTPDKLPHRGLGIDIRAALPATTPAIWLDLLERLLATNPDERAVDWQAWLPLLRGSSSTNTAAGSTASNDRFGAAQQAPPAAYRAESEWVVGAGSSLPFVFVVLLLLIRAVLFLVLQVALPTLLMILSVVFGRGLRQAAAESTRAGHDADRHLASYTKRLAQSGPAYVRHQRRFGPMGPMPYGPGAWGRARPPSPNQPTKPRRMRVGNFDVELPTDAVEPDHLDNRIDTRRRR